MPRVKSQATTRWASLEARMHQRSPLRSGQDTLRELVQSCLHPGRALASVAAEQRQCVDHMSWQQSVSSKSPLRLRRRSHNVPPTAESSRISRKSLTASQGTFSGLHSLQHTKRNHPTASTSFCVLLDHPVKWVSVHSKLKKGSQRSLAAFFFSFKAN